MIKIHKEGRKLLLVLLFALIIINGLVFLLAKFIVIPIVTVIISIILFTFFTYFFRSSNRIISADNTYVVAPADGTVVVIEPVEEDEILKEKRIQLSIFMSVTDVHQNWYPISGKILHVSHRDGRKRAAYLPKSSKENECSSIVIEAYNKQTILVRQIAGALARRIVTYAKEGEECRINEQLGFIKFGSRIDLFLPMDAEILVDLKDNTIGNETILAKLRH